MRNSIRTRLTVAFISLAIGPLLLVGVILAWQSFTTQEQQALNLQREVARRVATEITAFFEELENVLRLVSKAHMWPGLGRIVPHSILPLLMSQNIFEELVLLDSQGQEQINLSRIGHFSTDQGHYPEADEFVIPQTTGEVYYSPVRFDESTGEPLMTIAVPVFDVRTGQADGVLVSEIRLKEIWNLIADIQVNPGQKVYIVDAQNRVIAHRNPSVVLRDTSFDVPDQDGIQLGLTGESTVLAVNTVRFDEQEFNIVAEQTVSEALALAINTVFITGVLIVAALVIASSLGFLIVRQIVQPIQAMATTAQAISAGDLSQQVQVASQDELGVLATAFNSMTTQLRTIITGLEQQITERKRAEKELKRYHEHLEELVKERTRELEEAQEQLVRREKLAVLGKLAGGVAHELRNPLGAINNAVYYLKKVALSDANEKTREYLKLISTELRYSDKIISELLDFARINSVNKEEIRVSKLVAQVLEKYAPPQGIQVTTKIPSDLPLVSIDPIQMEQILTNLVINAYQAMPEGGNLTIRAKAENGRIAVSVADTGYGISEEHKKKLFEPLFTTKAQGIGLGLAISKNLVETNGGTIEVESEAGKGSTFTIRIASI